MSSSNGLRQSLTAKADRPYSLDVQSSPKDDITNGEANVSICGAFRILDLPAEIRRMIFGYFYDSKRIVLRYYWEEPNPSRGPNLRLLPTKRIRLSNLPQTTLHYVCRQFTLDANRVIDAKGLALTIDNEAHHKECFMDLIRNDKYSFLRSRLVSLKYISGSNDGQVPWSELVRACPKLRTVEVVTTTYDPIPTKDRGMCTSGEEYAQLIVQETMSQSIEQMHELDSMALPDLARVLEHEKKGKYSVIGTYRRVCELLSGAGLSWPLKNTICECVGLKTG